MVNYDDFKNKLNEMSLNDQKIKNRIDGLLNQTLNFNEIKKEIIKFVEDIQEKIKNISLNELKFTKRKKYKDDDIILFDIEYPRYISNEYFIMMDEISSSKFTSDQKLDIKTILFGDLNNQNSSNVLIQIEKNNFNQIHIYDGIPLSFQKLGLGKKIFLKILDEVNFISTQKDLISEDAANIFLSFSNDKKLYSFQSDTKNIIFKSIMNIDKIQKIVNEFFENEKYDVDDDFEEKIKINEKYEDKN